MRVQAVRSLVLMPLYCTYYHWKIERTLIVLHKMCAADLVLLSRLRLGGNRRLINC